MKGSGGPASDQIIAIANKGRDKRYTSHLAYQPIFEQCPSLTTQIYLARDNALPGCGISIDSGQAHTLVANFLDTHLRSAVAIDLLCPTDAEINRIALAVAAQAGCACARAYIGAGIFALIYLQVGSDGARHDQEATAIAVER